jgi:hypothetical protein
MTSTTLTEPIHWSAAQKVALRFFLVFFSLYIFFYPNGAVPFADAAFRSYIQPFHQFIPWLADRVLHTGPVTIFANGSGDTTFDYLTLLFIGALAVVSTAVWSAIDRKARNYNKLFYWACVIVRYYVGITMLTYGFVKVIKLQFHAPTPGRLLEPFGNASPMGLAWTYMGYSTGFNYFTGFGEIACGLLLLFRKTTTFGAILGVVVAGNIVAINYCFDVPVKLLSTTLVVMCLFLLVKDAVRLTNFLLLNKPALSADITPHRFKDRWKNTTLRVIKYLFIIYVLIGYTIRNLQTAKIYGELATKPPFYGIYEVQSFVRNKDTIAPLTTDTSRWRKLVISYPGYAQVKLMNDSSQDYSFVPNLKTHVITMHNFIDCR